jgi:beta-1,4-mannosyl-glycoprotein beta-1,4-N-acetylglucosaminyltransferase
MKIYDCFMYFDEDLMLDIRLNILNQHVDGFIIAEATLDHAGNAKKINFDINKFSKFKNKINHIIVEDIPKHVTSLKKDWHPAHIRDQFQRNALERGYKNAKDEDLIMISDIDEIPDPNKIANFKKKNKYACFIQKNFQSKINQLNITEPSWPGTKICLKKFLKSPQWLRNLKTKQYPFWKIYKPKNLQLILDGGWHFSFLKKSDDVSKKIKSFAHQEYNNKKFVDQREIENRIKSRSDIFDRNFKYQKINLNQDFPEYILRNTSKFKDWVL